MDLFTAYLVTTVSMDHTALHVNQQFGYNRMHLVSWHVCQQQMQSACILNRFIVCDSNPCMYHGSCYETSPYYYICYCTPDRFGINCHEPMISNLTMHQNSTGKPAYVI